MFIEIFAKYPFLTWTHLKGSVSEEDSDLNQN